MFKIANLHPDFSTKRDHGFGDLAYWDPALAASPERLTPVAMLQHASEPLLRHDEAQAFLIHEMDL